MTAFSIILIMKTDKYNPLITYVMQQLVCRLDKELFKLIIW